MREAGEAWLVFADRTVHGDPRPLAGFAGAGLHVRSELLLSAMPCCEALLRTEEYDYMLDVDVKLYRLGLAVGAAKIKE